MRSGQLSPGFSINTQYQPMFDEEDVPKKNSIVISYIPEKVHYVQDSEVFVPLNGKVSLRLIEDRFSIRSVRLAQDEKSLLEPDDEGMVYIEQHARRYGNEVQVTGEPKRQCISCSIL